MKRAIDILKEKRYYINPGELNYCTDSGIEFFIGHKNQATEAGVVALIHDDDLYMLDKDDLKNIQETAKTFGISKVNLYTNYGIEMHSKHERPELLGFNKIEKIQL